MNGEGKNSLFILSKVEKKNFVANEVKLGNKRVVLYGFLWQFGGKSGKIDKTESEGTCYA